MKLNNLSISSKLILLSLATSLISLLAAITAIAAYDRYSLRNLLEQEFSVLASVIANRSSAAVVFEDAALAQTNLSSLQYRNGVELGCIYRNVNVETGERIRAPELLALFSSVDHGQRQCPAVQSTGIQRILVGDEYLEILQPIELDGSQVGVLYLKASLAETYTRMQQKLPMLSPVMIMAAAIAMIIGTLLSRHISRPLLLLGKTATQVAAHDNYAIRAEKFSDDEVGQVVDSFNQMLSVIEREDAHLRESEEKFRLISESSKVGIFQLDGNGHCLYANEEMMAITGLTLEQLQAQGWLGVVHPDDKRRVADQFQLLFKGVEISLDCSLYLADGAVKWVTGNIAPLHDAARQQKGYLGTLSDITELKQAFDQLEQMAFYDTLTGLANRRLFRNRLEHMLGNISRSGSGVALILIDLDHFKHVNDSMGHDSGEALLTVISERLKHCVRFTDTVSRLGGDEFAVILPNVPDTLTVSNIAEKILFALSKAVLLDDQEISISASLGISMAPEDTSNAENLFKNADLALYKAKEEGRNNFKFFTSEMNTLLVDHLKMVSQLRQAIEQENFYLQYQPQIDLISGQLVGFEALVRWRHPERGFVSPVQFIPVAEETDLIIPLGRWILKTACQQMRALSDAKLVNNRAVMTVNLSIKQFDDLQLVDFIDATLREHGLQPAQLELELTETVLMENLEETISSLNSIKDLGVSLSIDDFGTGYSSLGYLKRLPVNVVKVDRSFVMDIPHDRDDMEITAAVIAMAHKLRYKVVAEGIETREQYEFLRESGCDYGQGYYFSPPLHPDELVDYCRHYQQEL